MFICDDDTRIAMVQTDFCGALKFSSMISPLLAGE